jgi:Na+-translocating ferredoxin:NAD+ oxidoreductase RNF subunit RnfB
MVGSELLTRCPVGGSNAIVRIHDVIEKAIRWTGTTHITAVENDLDSGVGTIGDVDVECLGVNACAEFSLAAATIEQIISCWLDVGRGQGKETGV